MDRGKEKEKEMLWPSKKTKTREDCPSGMYDWLPRNEQIAWWINKKSSNFFILDHRSGASVFAVNPLTPTNTLTGQEHVNTIFSVFVYCRNAICAVMSLYICQL